MNILNSKANLYWTGDEKSESQRLYIQFTLFVSAVSDFAIGMELKDKSRLNWSASAFYYSMVHAGRFIIFSCLGDFPTSHDNLKKVIKGENEICGNWLYKFTNNKRILNSRENNFKDKFPIDSLKEFYQNLEVFDFDSKLSHLGKIIEKSKKLREDSNYESLLIAHEYDHIFVTDYFKSLTEHLSRGCEFTLEFISELFVAFINRYPFHNIPLENVKGFIDYYIGKRIVKQLNDRGFSNSIRDRIREIVSEGLKTTTVDVQKFQKMEEDISFELFDMKSNLMNDFKRKVIDLEQAVQGE